MRFASVLLLGCLAGCGGDGPEEPPILAFQAKAMSRAEDACSTHNGIGGIIRQTPIYWQDILLDVVILCRCRDGHTFTVNSRD